MVNKVKKTPKAASSAKKQSSVIKTVQDPFALREAEKYDKPIPSREYLLDYIQKQKKPVDYETLKAVLGLSDSAQTLALHRRLKAMVRDEQLEKLSFGRYFPAGKRHLVTGKVTIERQKSKVRYSLLIDETGEKHPLDVPEGQAVFAGQVIVASILPLPKDEPQWAKLVEVKDQLPMALTGRFIRDGGLPFVIPYSRELKQDLLIPEDKTLGAENGQIVSVHVLPGINRWGRPIAEVTAILGDEHTAGIEIKTAILGYGLPDVWPEAALDELLTFGETVPESAKQDRLDLRHCPFVTIDGEDAKDFDDAVFAEKMPRGGFRLWVAIADVSHYVKPGTALDKAALERGNSVYFPGKVIPMLPEALSNGLCSLKPKVDRLCLVAELRLNAAGKLTRYAFHEAVIHSHERLTYTKVAKLLASESASLAERYEAILPHLQVLQAVYQVLYEARVERGAIEFETTETRIVFGQEGKISRIDPVERNEAHRLIEECMLAANVATARFLKKHKMPSLYRNHEGPPLEKITHLQTFLKELGLQLGGGVDPSPLDYTALLKRIQDRPDALIIQTVLLRSLSQAVYSPHNLGHFGLAYPEYCHFTSPIRRYPDLFVHRQIRAVLQGTALPPQNKDEKAELLNELSEMGQHCSMTERRADEATRDASRWLKCQYLHKQLGDTFEGVISGVVHFGFFVELKALGIDGLVHVNNLHEDYYEFDAAHHCLRGENSGKRFRLGDSVRVRLIRVDMDNRKLDFDYLPSSEEHQKNQARRFEASRKGKRSLKQKSPKNATKKPDKSPKIVEKETKKPLKKKNKNARNRRRKKQDKA